MTEEDGTAELEEGPLLDTVVGDETDEIDFIEVVSIEETDLVV